MGKKVSQKDLYIIHKSKAPLVMRLILMALIYIVVLILLGILFQLTESISIVKINILYIVPFVVLLVLAGGGYFIIEILDWLSEYYEITKINIIRRYGVLSKTEENYNVKVIKNMQVSQSLFGRMFNYGNLEISFLGGNINLESIPNPHFFEQVIRNFHPPISEAKAEAEAEKAEEGE